MGLSSIILVKPEDLPTIIKDRMKVIIDKILEISKKNMSNKLKNKDGDEDKVIIFT